MLTKPRFRIRSLLLLITLAALSVPLIGQPIRIDSGWTGAGYVTTWHIIHSDRGGYYYAIWTEPRRTGIPVQVLFEIEDP